MKILLPFGFYAAPIFIIHWVSFHIFLLPDDGQMDFGSGEWLGYITMLLALSTVYFGVRKYRDHELNGVISFKDAFLNGLIIVLIASAIYVIVWMIYYPLFLPDFANQYMASEVIKLEESGLTGNELQLKIQEMEDFNEMYKQPAVMAGFTFLEIFPIGVIVTIISALILKKSS
ncbi:MAG: DUF4199 domain-containing protein [Cyclobacteriaceae bacterium]